MSLLLPFFIYILPEYYSIYIYIYSTLYPIESWRPWVLHATLNKWSFEPDQGHKKLFQKFSKELPFLIPNPVRRSRSPSFDRRKHAVLDSRYLHAISKGQIGQGESHSLLQKPIYTVRNSRQVPYIKRQSEFHSHEKTHPVHHLSHTQSQRDFFAFPFVHSLLNLYLSHFQSVGSELRFFFVRSPSNLIFISFAKCWKRIAFSSCRYTRHWSLSTEHFSSKKKKNQIILVSRSQRYNYKKLNCTSQK